MPSISDWRERLKAEISVCLSKEVKNGDEHLEQWIADLLCECVESVRLEPVEDYFKIKDHSLCCGRNMNICDLKRKGWNAAVDDLESAKQSLLKKIKGE